MTDERILKIALAKSHRQQFDDVDWQAAATNEWQSLPERLQTDDNFTMLSESPEPDCECDFCKTAKWEDEKGQS